MKGKTPNKANKRRFDVISQIGCVVCKKHLRVFSPPEIHHIDGRKSQEAHKKTIGLCFHHHRGGEDGQEYTSRHPSKAAFERRYGSEKHLLAYQDRLIRKHEGQEEEFETGGLFL
ncbi:recombinase [Candidatus Pacearchaeota archaeon]|nr:recombinase [Candidatus Pacearchaeota archaeon]